MEADAYKVTLLVLDFERYGEDETRRQLENLKYLSTSVMDISRERIAWSDAHPLNHRDKQAAAFAELFGVKTPAATDSAGKE